MLKTCVLQLGVCRFGPHNLVDLILLQIFLIVLLDKPEIVCTSSQIVEIVKEWKMKWHLLKII